MKMKEFKEELVAGMEKAFDRNHLEVTFCNRMVNKLNESYEGMVITPKGSNVGVTLNINNMYEAYENGKSLSEIIEKASDIAMKSLDNKPQFDMATLTNYDAMKEKLIVDVVSTKANKDMLANIPHKEMEDMSVVYRFEVGAFEDGRATILATNQMIETMGVSAEQLHADAMENAPKNHPAEIKGMLETFSEMMGASPEELILMGMNPSPADEKMIVASVPDKRHGACVITYPHFMEDAAEKMGGDFFILPSSIHEVLLVKDDGSLTVEELKTMVMDINASEVQPEDKLTDNVYHYDCQNHIFESAEKYEKKQLTA